MEVYHVNWHVFANRPVFESAERVTWLRTCLSHVTVTHGLPVFAFEIAPTHVHVLLATLPDLPRDEIVRLMKGVSSRRFFQAYPALRCDLSGFLWQRGYHWVQVKNHRQFANTLRYVHANATRHGIPLNE